MQMADLVPSDNGKNGFCVVEWKNPTGDRVGSGAFGEKAAQGSLDELFCHKRKKFGTSCTEQRLTWEQKT